MFGLRAVLARTRYRRRWGKLAAAAEAAAEKATADLDRDESHRRSWRGQLTPEQRAEIARKGAASRWRKLQ
jgi:hypothetical protein